MTQQPPVGQAPEGQEPDRLAALRAFRHRNYRLFFSGQLVSLVGTWMQSVAQAWLVYKLTHSALLLGTLSFCGQVPIFLFASIGGAVADRYDKRRIILCTQLISMFLAFVLAALTLAGHVAVWHLILLASLLGLTNAFDIPTRQAFIVEMVGKEDLLNAIALNSSMFNGARIMGPALAGVLVYKLGEGWCFFGNGVSYAAVVVGLLMMQGPWAARRPIEGTAFERIRDGFLFVARHRRIRALLGLLSVTSMTSMSYVVVMPIFADQVLHGDAGTLGKLMSATGIGALLGALRLAGRKDTAGLARWVVVSVVGFGLVLALFAFSRDFRFSMLLLALLGYMMITQMAATNTLVQTMAPDHLRGRVMSVYSMFFMGTAPFGSLAAGFAAHRAGAQGAAIIGGVVTVVAAGLFAVAYPWRAGVAEAGG